MTGQMDHNGKVYALLLSGGTGTRTGLDIPKQYVEVGGRPIISYSMERLFSHSGISAIQIVADPAWHGKIYEWITAEGLEGKFKGFSNPGRNRQLSIFNGLRDIREYAEDSDLVFIHDAARPLLTEEQIGACIEGMDGYDGVLPVLPMKDTVYSSTDGKRITALLNRAEIYAGRLLPEKILHINGSTEPAVMAGLRVAMIPGDEGNFKVTTIEDLERFRKMIQEERRE